MISHEQTKAENVGIYLLRLYRNTKRNQSKFHSDGWSAYTQSS